MMPRIPNITVANNIIRRLTGTKLDRRSTVGLRKKSLQTPNCQSTNTVAIIINPAITPQAGIKNSSLAEMTTNATETAIEDAR
jgi:hypothetical protein